MRDEGPSPDSRCLRPGHYNLYHCMHALHTCIRQRICDAIDLKGNAVPDGTIAKLLKTTTQSFRSGILDDKGNALTTVLALSTPAALLTSDELLAV